jgi:hypothetical protein
MNLKNMEVKPKIEPISACCRAPMFVSTADEGTACYVCASCNLPTDPIHISQMSFCANEEYFKKLDKSLDKMLETAILNGTTFTDEWKESNQDHKLKQHKSWYKRFLDYLINKK